MTDTNKDRQNAVREAWKSERAHVRNGKGTRDWSQSEQRQIVAKGRANGYEGHHMKSVRDYPQYAGDPDNIQFLNRSEHINGAHRGYTKNSTNGYYNPKNGTIISFSIRKPKAPPLQALSQPLTQRGQDIAEKSELARRKAAGQARAEAKQSVSKVMPANQQSTNKGIETARQKTAISQVNNQSMGKSSNKGIQEYRARSSSQSAGSVRGNESSSVKASGSSSGQSSGGQGR